MTRRAIRRRRDTSALPSGGDRAYENAMVHSRSMFREIGTAFAVLALYLLMILTPLHQARATQVDLAALGYQTVETGWVLCSGDTDRNETKTLVSKCPAAGIAKQQLAEPTPVVLASGLARPILSVVYALPPHHQLQARLNPAAPPRGPPASA
ncbi:MAG: hypothetical protein ABI414_12925 [Devosia sp.]